LSITFSPASKYFNLFEAKLVSPPKNDIVIFDKNNCHYIVDYILYGIPVSVYNIKPVVLYISIPVICLFIRSLRIFNWRRIRSRQSKLRGVIKELLLHYHLACLKFIQPFVIITFIDNSSEYHWFAERYTGPHFIAIQNGNRTNEQLEKKVTQFHQNFYCFGKYEVDRYKHFGHNVNSFRPVGSLLGGYYKFTTHEKVDSENKYDLGIVSQYSHDIFKNSSITNSSFIKSTNLLNTFLSRYISEHNSKAVVLLRSNDEKSGETDYLKKYYGNKIEYRINNKKTFSTYQGMEDSNVIIGFFSTASIEAFGWGKKILHCDFTGTKIFNDYDSIIMFTTPNYDVFKKRLDDLRNEKYKHYNERTKKYASYLMNNDPNHPPHLLIRNKINDILKSFNRGFQS